MRAKDARKFQLPAPEQITVPELGGDGVVTICPVTFGRRVELRYQEMHGQAGASSRGARMCAIAVVDDDGVPIMDADGWDAFATRYEEQFVALMKIVSRLAGLDGEAVKKT